MILILLFIGISVLEHMVMVLRIDRHQFLSLKVQQMENQALDIHIHLLRQTQMETTYPTASNGEMEDQHVGQLSRPLVLQVIVLIVSGMRGCIPSKQRPKILMDWRVIGLNLQSASQETEQSTHHSFSSWKTSCNSIQYSISYYKDSYDYKTKHYLSFFL